MNNKKKLSISPYFELNHTANRTNKLTRNENYRVSYAGAIDISHFGCAGKMNGVEFLICFINIAMKVLNSGLDAMDMPLV